MADCKLATTDQLRASHPEGAESSAELSERLLPQKRTRIDQAHSMASVSSSSSCRGASSGASLEGGLLARPQAVQHRTLTRCVHLLRRPAALQSRYGYGQVHPLARVLVVLPVGRAPRARDVPPPRA
mmetsp:Transcript_15644/g.39982  ORF Transcript_15644/g.39982 Transcript_15644/m.39982 type:complete len:127 (-) Transcript_15644:1355-1735(-)